MKLNDRLNLMMQNKGTQGVIVIGLTEAESMQEIEDIGEIEVSIKRVGLSQNTICKVKDIARFI